MPTKTHLRDITYENSTTRLTQENTSAKTHLRDLSYENKPTRAHLLNSTTKHIYKKSTTRTHQQEFTLTYKILPTKPYLGIQPTFVLRTYFKALEKCTLLYPVPFSKMYPFVPSFGKLYPFVPCTPQKNVPFCTLYPLVKCILLYLLL